MNQGIFKRTTKNMRVDLCIDSMVIYEKETNKANTTKAKSLRVVANRGRLFYDWEAGTQNSVAGGAIILKVTIQST